MAASVVGLMLLILAPLQPGHEPAPPNVTKVPPAVRDTFKLAPFYKKHIDYHGFPIVSSEKVSDAGLMEARHLIDQMLRDAGWVVQKTGAVDLTASRGVAVREFQTANGPVDYLLYIDRKPIGTIG